MGAWLDIAGAWAASNLGNRAACVPFTLCKLFDNFIEKWASKKKALLEARVF